MSPVAGGPMCLGYFFIPNPLALVGTKGKLSLVSVCHLLVILQLSSSGVLPIVLPVAVVS